ncbi:allergin-1 isoform X1 [Pezoporus flaviventris]|uniref:allergin-1 isoform X1 n=1 Tax=Pezoporus flaviventris TaxID=889875 RepID=UPI002AB2836E|nr:allergin-1 isoform X1 [Pezoporus flaviventris]
MVFLMILLFSYLQTSQQIQKTMVNGKEMLSNPRLKPVQGTLNVVMNQNVTLSCNSDSGSPPVRYTLFKRNQKVSTLNRPDLTPSLFNLTINSASDLGEYKCKAENNNTSGGKYSNSLSFTLLEPISKPVLSSPTSQAKKGQNVTLSCLSENGSLPITYIFFKGTQSISSQVMMHKEAAEIVLFINSSSDFGTYKCRAENGFRRNAKYSNGFNFTLAEERRLSQPLIISLGLIVLLFAIGLALAIPFFIIPSYKAKKFKPTRPSTGFTSTPNVEEPEDEVIYSEIMPVKPEEEYINFSVLRREDEKGDKRVCATVYSRVLSRD